MYDEKAGEGSVTFTVAGMQITACVEVGFDYVRGRSHDIEPETVPAWAVTDWAIDGESDYVDELLGLVDEIVSLSEIERRDLRENLRIPSLVPHKFVEACVDALLDSPEEMGVAA